MRLLTESDVPQAIELCRAAGWNQLQEDWSRLIALEPLGCFCIEADERIAATTTLLTYGRELAWLGMVLTHPDHRRKGYARQLVTAALELAAARQIRTVKLDATDQGKPLYNDLGFEGEQPIERWFREPGPIASVDAVRGAYDKTLDRRAFGLDRSKYLDTMGEPFVNENAYAFCRPSFDAFRLGPCVATNFASASNVVTACLQTKSDQRWYWDLLPANAAAVALASSLGFQCGRKLTRMVKGEQWTGDDGLVYAVAGFEAG